MKWRTAEQRRVDKDLILHNKYKNGFPWFAWYPVSFNGHWFWLTTIMRFTHNDYWDRWDKIYFSYKEIQNETSVQKP